MTALSDFATTRARFIDDANAVDCDYSAALEALTRLCATIALDRHGVTLGRLAVATIDGPQFAAITNTAPGWTLQDWTSPACLVTVDEAEAIAAAISNRNAGKHPDDINTPRGWTPYPIAPRHQPKPISAEAALAKIHAANLTLPACWTMTDDELLSRPTIGRRTLAYIRSTAPTPRGWTHAETSTEDQPIPRWPDKQSQTAAQAIRDTIRTTAAQLSEAIRADLTTLDAAPLDVHAARRMQTSAADLAVLGTILCHDIAEERARLDRITRYLSSS